MGTTRQKNTSTAITEKQTEDETQPPNLLWIRQRMCKTALRLPLAACRCNGQPCETMCQKPGHKNDKSTNATLRCVSLCALDCPESPHNGYIAQWLERLTADQQVPGSNPGVPSLGARFLFGFRALLVRLAYAAASACLNTNKPTSNMCWFLALASCLRFVCSSFASLVFPLAVLFRRFGRIGTTSKPKLLHSRAGRSASRLASENVCHFLRLRDFHRNLADNARSGLKPVSLKRKRSAQTCQLWGSNPRAVACSGS